MLFGAMAAAQASAGGGARPVESVWDFPRPAVLEPIKDEVKIVFGGVTVVETMRAMRTRLRRIT